MPAMTTTRKKRPGRQPGYDAHPAQLAALGLKGGPPLTPGEETRPHRIRTDAATHARLGTMTAKQRGDLIRAALGLRPGEPSESDNTTP